ncbi:MAG: FkbM family methyltransferase [Ktedonobacterales bacterium]
MPTTTLRTQARRLVADTIHHLPTDRGKWRLAGIAGRMLVEAAPVGTHCDVARIPGGSTMYVDLSDLFQRHIYFAGLYERHLTNLFQRLLRPGDTFVDGGANIGYFTILGSALVGPAGTVHSFEPIPATFAALRANVAMNALTQAHLNQMALADKAGELSFEVPVDAETGNALGWAATTVRMGRGPTITVPAGTLDDYAASHLLASIRLAKLDLEGGELAAIAGMASLLRERRIEYLCCEVNHFLLDNAGIPREALFSAMAGFGYTCFQIGENLRAMPPLHQETASAAVTHGGDYLFVAPGVAEPHGLLSRR